VFASSVDDVFQVRESSINFLDPSLIVVILEAVENFVNSIEDDFFTNFYADTEQRGLHLNQSFSKRDKK
jgi:cyclopropane fatty-acyl-phospholipid synthase-like methyltransferase